MRPADVLPGSLAWSDLAVALFELARGRALVEWGDAGPASSRWLEAALAYAAGDFARAAEAYMQIGALPEEAHARFRAGSNAVARRSWNGSALRATCALRGRQTDADSSRSRIQTTLTCAWEPSLAAAKRIDSPSRIGNVTNCPRRR